VKKPREIPLGLPALSPKTDWSEVESEVAHYAMHEPGAPSSSMEPQGGTPTAEPKPPRFPVGADYLTMMTAWIRFREADKFMPYRNDSKIRRPSCLMVLRAAYGTQACRYDDQAPNGEALLKYARLAYCMAADTVPRWKSRTAGDRVRARFDRHFGGGGTT